MSVIIGFMTEVTQILSQIDQGDPGAAELLLPLLYDELRKLAAAKLANEKTGQTLQPTALVHEAYLRLVGPDNDQDWNGRGHFFGAAAEAMRRILVDNARRKHALKRGGDWERLPDQLYELAENSKPKRLLDIDDAVKKLGTECPEMAKLVVLRYFGGLNMDEAAAAMEISVRTAHRYWAYAKAWLKTELNESRGD